MDKISGNKNLDNAAISKLFKDYVSSTENRSRHTAAAEMEVELYTAYCDGAFPHNIRLKNGLYEKMMNVAVEYEESGFIAGFLYAKAILSGQEDRFNMSWQNPSKDVEKSPHKAVKGSYKELPRLDITGKDFITSKQIADMFDTSNGKVVARIEKQILPYLDEESKTFFCKVDGINTQHKPVKFYKMNRAGCSIYLKTVEPKKKSFINIAGGYAKLQELMDKVFPPDIRIATT